MNEIDSVVPYMGREEIRKVTAEIRDHVGGSEKPWFNIVRFVELWLPAADDTFLFEIAEDSDPRLAGIHAMYRPDSNTITVRETVYERACKGAGQDRMTIAHEFGHYELHRNVSPTFARTTKQLPRELSAEWQAKAFAGELLVDHRQMSLCMDYLEVADTFGVSWTAARFQRARYGD